MHHGTTINPEVQTDVPGGSCSGAAVAVAAGLVDFALGIFVFLEFSLKFNSGLVIFFTMN